MLSKTQCIRFPLCNLCLYIYQYMLLFDFGLVIRCIYRIFRSIIALFMLVIFDMRYRRFHACAYPPAIGGSMM